MGMSVSPDECSLALRGLQTLAVRLHHSEVSALSIANWLAVQPEVQTVLHPALDSCPGHEFWKRDFCGASGLFSLVFHPQFSGAQVRAFVDALDLFKIGYSWAGTTSLAVTYNLNRSRGNSPYADRLVRLSIGMEDTGDLIDDLKQALERMQAAQ
jgi:cystathionine beta-lyase